MTWEALMDRTSSDKSYCYPSYETIAADTGVSRAQAKRNVAELKLFGLIELTPVHADNGRQRTNRVAFVWRDIADLARHGRGSDMPPPTASHLNRASGSEMRPPRGSHTNPKPDQKEPDEPEPHHHQTTKSLKTPPTPSFEHVVGNGVAQRSCSDTVSKSRADDDEKIFLSPLEELVFRCRARGGRLTETDWRWLSGEIEIRGITREDFTEQVRHHLKNPRLTNPVGFLKSFVRQFRGRTTEVRPEPSPASPVIDKCELCGSPRGNGLRLIGQAVVPCGCATPEFVEEFLAKEAARTERLRQRETSTA